MLVTPSNIPNTHRARLVEVRGAVRGEGGREERVRGEGRREEGGEMAESQSQRRDIRPLSAATSRSLKRTTKVAQLVLHIFGSVLCKYTYIVDENYFDTGLKKTVTDIQWNPSIAATVGESIFGCYTEVAVVEGFHCTLIL